jgi:starch synthase (maltosyl-transferring)
VASAPIGRIPILDVQPLVDGGRWPAKAVVDEEFEVSATVFREGHDALGCNVVLVDPKGRPGPWTPMRPVGIGIDRYAATVCPDREGGWAFFVEAWSDPYATWVHDAEIKVPAEIDVELVLEEGALLLERAAKGVPPKAGRRAVAAAAKACRDRKRPPAARLAPALAADVVAALAAHPLRELVTASEPQPLRVERERALFSAWYELFPRSEGAVVDPDGRRPPRSGTFATASLRLPAVAAMGFDVVYLPPIHPVGRSHRKGPNNTLVAGPHDPGVPWAIGSPEGGHDALHPDLGTLADLDAFVSAARDVGLEVAIDLALQASPDHPWVTEHPDWFHHRADGSIAYAENPPKKYQDIYPLAFDADLEGMLAEVERICRHWMAHGVRIFRVDNPHTKPLVFWERLLGAIRATDPDVLWLSEAFTRPAMMRTLAKLGFSQSYTYFTWRTSKGELTEYALELAGETSAYLRPNFFVNTPDILHASLQYGGPPMFKIRAVLASTLSPSWGVYAGYELYEHVALRPGSEEYLDSEKYQYRPRDWARAEAEGRTLAPYLTRLNEIRQAHPALRWLRNLRFHHTEDDAILAYSKTRRLRDGSTDTVLVICSLDPHHTRETTVWVDLPALGMDWSDRYDVRDEITGSVWNWGQANFVRLDPGFEPAHILRIQR